MSGFSSEHRSPSDLMAQGPPTVVVAVVVAVLVVVAVVVVVLVVVDVVDVVTVVVLPWQIPDSHVSLMVLSLPSSHGLPSDFAGPEK